MTVTSATSTSSTSATSLGAPTAAPDAPGTTSFDPQSFMRLLIAQIQHQDPLQPMDATQMTQQLTQLTEVERLVSIDGQLGNLSVATASVANTQATDLVGRSVEADTSHVLLPDSAPGEGAFTLASPAANVTVQIRDDQGRVVRTLSLGSGEAGANAFEWDGHDDQGTRCAAGSYTISVAATDASNQPVDATTTVDGTVTEVTYQNGYPELSVGGAHVVLGDVRSVGPAPAAPTTP